MGNVIDARKKFLWKQCCSRLRRGEIKTPSSKELLNELKEAIISPPKININKYWGEKND
jgi:hypothetical protein